MLPGQSIPQLLLTEVGKGKEGMRLTHPPPPSRCLLLKMDETSSQQVLVSMFDVENCIVCFEVNDDVISGHSRLI